MRLSKWRSYYAKHLHSEYVYIILGWQPPPRNLIKYTHTRAFCLYYVLHMQNAMRECAHVIRTRAIVSSFLAHDAGRWMELNPRTTAPAKGILIQLHLVYMKSHSGVSVCIRISQRWAARKCGNEINISRSVWSSREQKHILMPARKLHDNSGHCCHINYKLHINHHKGINVFLWDIEMWSPTQWMSL